MMMISICNVVGGTFWPGLVMLRVTGIQVTRIVPSWGPESTLTSIGGSGRPGQGSNFKTIKITKKGKIIVKFTFCECAELCVCCQLLQKPYQALFVNIRRSLSERRPSSVFIFQIFWTKNEPCSRACTSCHCPISRASSSQQIRRQFNIRLEREAIKQMFGKVFRPNWSRAHGNEHLENNLFKHQLTVAFEYSTERHIFSNSCWHIYMYIIWGGH